MHDIQMALLCWYFEYFHIRDTLIYAVSANRKGLPVVLDMLAEVTLLPQIREEEVSKCLN